MKVQVPEGLKAEEVVKRMFCLAWQACGGPLGMGVLQDRPGASEDEIWENVGRRGDYPGDPDKRGPSEAYGDYVFGRMMKLSVHWDDAEIDLGDDSPRGDYQAWCGEYHSYQALFDAAVEAVTV